MRKEVQIALAVKIRLKRMGAKRDASYRIVVSDMRFARDGRFIEEIGWYDPLRQPARVNIDEDKARSWMDKGAQLSETVRSLFRKAGILRKDAAPSVDERG